MAFLTYQTLRCENIIPTKVVSTHLWYTPLNLYQKAKEGVFFILSVGDCLGGAPGVCWNNLWWVPRCKCVANESLVWDPPVKVKNVSNLGRASLASQNIKAIPPPENRFWYLQKNRFRTWKPSFWGSSPSFFGNVHPGRWTAGTYSHHPLERKILWTKPPGKDVVPAVNLPGRVYLDVPGS